MGKCWVYLRKDFGEFYNPRVATIQKIICECNYARKTYFSNILTNSKFLALPRKSLDMAKQRLLGKLVCI